jgi:hypothetical protein
MLLAPVKLELHFKIERYQNPMKNVKTFFIPVFIYGAETHLTFPSLLFCQPGQLLSLFSRAWAAFPSPFSGRLPLLSSLPRARTWAAVLALLLAA